MIRLAPAPQALRAADTQLAAPPASKPEPAQETRATPASSTGIVARAVPDGPCPACGKSVTFGLAVPLSDTLCPHCGAVFMVPGHLDSFILLERIGSGEMGQIYRARDLSLDREVAIKVVLAARAEEGGLHERLSREARAAARLSHPRVAQVHALGFSNGHPYLVMELVRGKDMEAMLRSEGRIAERVALRAAAEVMEGLQALHREGLTHGDIKPANIVLDREGAAKLVDFGLSGMSRQDGNRSIVGTPQYIAPETLRGAPDSVQTDMYSLGASLYHMLSGKPPFEGATPTDVAKARLLGPAAPIGRHAPHVSAATQMIVMRMLESDPAQRYPDCTAALTEIRAALKALDAPAPVVPRATQQAVPVPPHAGLTGAQMASIPADMPTGKPALRMPVKTEAPAAAAATQPKPAKRPPRRLGLKVAATVVACVGLSMGLAALYLVYDARSPAAPPVPPSAPPAPAQTATYVPPEANATPPSATQVEATPVAPAADEQVAMPPRLLTPRWVTSGRGQSGRGSTFWHKGTLLLVGETSEETQERDIFRFVSTPLEGDFALSAQLVSASKAFEYPRTGLLVAEGANDLGATLFFGKQRDGTLALQVRQRGEPDRTVTVSRDPLALPSHLRIIRRGDTFSAATSVDGTVWTSFGRCTVALPARVNLGVAIFPGVPGVVSQVEFTGLTLRGSPLPDNPVAARN